MRLLKYLLSVLKNQIKSLNFSEQLNKKQENLANNFGVENQKTVKFLKSQGTMKKFLSFKLKSFPKSPTVPEVTREPDPPVDEEIVELVRVLGSVCPLEIEQRAMPGSSPEFPSRLDTGIDCDFVFRDLILVGNL